MPMIGFSPLMMDSRSIVLDRPSAPPRQRGEQLKSGLVTAMAWLLALLELAVAITLAVSQGLLIAMILMAPLDPPDQENQPKT